jgi:2'-5' RNA ligase
MHFTICYLGKKTTEQLDEFNTIYCRNLNSIDPAVSIDKILFRKSFVEGDGYIISLSVGSDRVYNLYKQFEIKAWKKEGHQDKEFTPHITMYKIP